MLQATAADPSHDFCARPARHRGCRSQRLSPLQNGARAYNKAPLTGWNWWAYNQNSGDTGGIVRNNWQQLDWAKLDWMVAALRLRPWYLRCEEASVCVCVWGGGASVREARASGRAQAGGGRRGSGGSMASLCSFGLATVGCDDCCAATTPHFLLARRGS